jgi:pyrrolidone-carboxylate peptidase
MQYTGQSREAIKKAVGHRSVYITDYSYNGSICSRAIEEFTHNPKNETIELVSSILRREVSEEEVMTLDVPLFSSRIKEIISECTRRTDDNSEIILPIPKSKGGRPKKEKEEREAEILQFQRIS